MATDEPRAVVRKIDGQLVLDDPVAVAVIHAVEKYNCHRTLELNADRVTHFKQRLADRGMASSEAVIVLVNVDDVHGGPLADALMPGMNWQEIRNRGEVPFARGIALRDGIQEALDIFDQEAGTKLRGMTDVAVVVVDHGVAEVFPANKYAEFWLLVPGQLEDGETLDSGHTDEASANKEASELAKLGHIVYVCYLDTIENELPTDDPNYDPAKNIAGKRWCVVVRK